MLLKIQIIVFHKLKGFFGSIKKKFHVFQGKTAGLEEFDGFNHEDGLVCEELLKLNFEFESCLFTVTRSVLMKPLAYLSDQAVVWV